MARWPARPSFSAWSSLLPLRQRLALYFLLVSVPAVLVASFIAAQAISATFERNVETWIGEIARFMANDAVEGQEESQNAATIVAAALSHAGISDDALSIGHFAELLTSVGYDFVRLYTADGNVLFSTGNVEPLQPLPKEPGASIFLVEEGGRRSMMVGGIQTLRVGEQDAFLFVANLLDEHFFTTPQSIHSLDLRLFEVTDDGRAIDLQEFGGTPFAVPASVLVALASGSEIAIERHSLTSGPAAAFTALRDGRGHLVGIIACRLNGVTAALERLGNFWLFLALAAVAGLISLLVGASISRRLSTPLRDLTAGVRAVAAGDYRTRVSEEGGLEMEELARGFNTMTAQLLALRHMEAAMRQKAQLATLGQAAAVIAHEIGNPLGIIKTSAELVRRKAPMAPSEDRLMGFVLDEVNRINRLVKELLDYSRPVQCQFAPLDLVRNIVRPVLDFIAPEAKRRQVTLAIRLPEKAMPVFADEDQLHQALLNLLLNAMDAAGEGGHVIVRVTAEGESAKVEVEDNGPGVPADVRETLFDPFVTTKVNGTGLGLATVRTAIEAHAGEVEYADAPFGGAIFSMRLPLSTKAEAANGREHTDR